jgi:hypothetical protein
MNKRLIGGIVTGVLLLALIGVAATAAGVGSEASKMDTMLKTDVTQHTQKDAVKKQLADAGYTIEQESPNIKATGPNHSLVVYSTHLTLDLGFDANGGLNSYHLERA